MDYRQMIEEKRQKLVDTLIDFIENNPTQWEAGWYSVPSVPPINGKTQKQYKGLNAFYLCVISAMRGYTDPRWVTFNQAKELGANVKSGEKSSEVFYWSKYDKKTKQSFEDKTCDGMTFEEARKYMDENVRPVMKFYQVFNAVQCDNMPEYSHSTTPEMEAEERRRQNALIEQIISNSGAPVSYDGGNRAYYEPSSDSIHLPEVKDFKSMQDYYATALHEIAHSTGHDSRLNRNLSGLFGTPDYAKEELRAELASVFMQVEYGISVEGKHFENHGAYLASWLKSVKNDQKEFFSASADAEKITSYVADNYLQEHKENEQDTEPKFEANTSFAKQVDAVLSGADTTSTHLKVMGTPLILRQLGSRNLPVLMTAKHLKNIVVTSGEDANVNYHGLDADIIKKLPELLSDPVMVMDSLTKDDSVVILTSTTDTENRPIIGAVKFDGKGYIDSVRLQANILTSVYGRNNFNDFIKRNVDANSILYWNKEKSQELIEVPGVQFPDKLNSLATNTIIRKAKAFVNSFEEKIENKVENVDNRRLSELETKISQDRIDELQHNFMNESNDEETQEWRDSLSPDEERIIAEWDKSYLKGTTELVRDIILAEKIEGKELINQTTSSEAIYETYKAYLRTKKENPNATVLQRIGDFYEVMGANATAVAEILELTLAGRDVGLSDRVPMCGFPYHVADKYISKLREMSDVVVRDNDGEKVLNKTVRQSEQAEQEAIEKAREEAHAAGLPFSDKYYDSEEDFNPNVFDGSMSVEDYNLMHSLIEANEQKKTVAPAQGKKPIVINFYAGPGAGKTTAALEFTAALKKAGVNVEYVSEYAKELVLEGKAELLGNQQHVTDEQYHRLDRLRNNVDVIVTDSPVLLGIVYGAERIDDAYRQQLRGYYDSFNNIDFHLERRTEYQTEGRVETEQQAKVLDTAISQMLRQQNITCHAFTSDALQETVELVKQAEQVRQVRQVGQSKWSSIPLDAALVGAERGKSTQLKMPDGEYSSFVFFAPTKFIRQDERAGAVQLSVNDSFKYTLMKGNQRVELTGSELRQAMAGQVVGQRAQRVLSAENAQTLSDIYRNVPQEMRQYPNWCVFTTRWNEEKGKKDKQIFSPVLGLKEGAKMQWASIDKPETWATFDAAMKFAEENDCVGLVYALDGKGISCIDLDKSVVLNSKLGNKPTDRAEGEMSALAARLSEELQGTYIETSASGNGIHIFVKDDLLAKGKYKNRAETPDGEIEVYDDRRFMSMTGNIRSKTLRLGKSPIATTAWLQEKLGEKVAVNQNAAPPRQSRQMDSSDSAVIERISRSRKGAEFEALYKGEDVTGDNSRNDFKLLNMLAFFTDCDSGQMERIFRDSSLYRPEKGEAYVQRSVNKACETLQTRMSDRGFFGGGNNRGGGRSNGK